jgi:hypothetical protein
MPGETGEITKSLCQDSRAPDQDMNQAPPECWAEVCWHLKEYEEDQITVTVRLTSVLEDVRHCFPNWHPQLRHITYS